MRNFACWRADDGYAIVNPDADAVPDYVFRAVHTDVPLQIRVGPDAPATMTNPESFLKKFLAPRDHVLVPVIGESGTGKSHLIRWMRLRLPPTKQREVIFVPKAETNLRDIIGELIKRLPREEQAQFASELQGAGDTLRGKEAQRTAILNEIQTALQNDQGDTRSGLDSEIEDYLLEGLRGVFLDPYLRQHHFLRDGGFAADLAAHVFERPSGYQPAEQRRVFTVSDLPLDVGGMVQAAASTQEFLSFLLAQDDLRDAAASIVGRHLDWAIGRCLNISGDRLIDLMLGIRRRLKAEGKSLILLIEDFARLQGLDRALLQSLIEQRDDLCVLRTAFASTTGFYRTVAETVLTRLTFVVDMNTPLGSEGQGIDLARFAARYLNALRQGEVNLRNDLQNWSGGEGVFDVSNRCDACDNIKVCHATFGEADGFGLYPFTRQALDQMADRADPEAHQKFNPRRFQKSVLRPVAFAAPELEAGRFPPPELLTSLGGVQKLGPAEQNRLRNVDPVNFERRRALLELWDGDGQVKNLPANLQTAFGLDMLRLETQPTPPSRPKPDTPPGPDIPRPPPTPTPSDARLRELTDWYNGQRDLSAATANDIRPLLFKAIDDAIDWDSEGLAPSDFRGSTRPFQASSLYFLNQATKRTANIVSIDIPSNWEDRDERYRTVMALQGILEAGKEGNWDFREGLEKLASLQECLSQWGKEIVRQIREMDAAEADWDPAACALAIRVAGALLCSSEATTRRDIDVVQAGLGPLAEVPAFANKDLVALVDQIRQHDIELLTIIASRRSAMKGGSKGDFVETATLLRAISPMRKGGFFPQSPPPKVPRVQTLERLAQLAKFTAAQLPSLVHQEAELRRAWLSEMYRAFGEAVTQRTILAVTEGLANDLGRFGIQGINELAAARLDFEDCAFDQALNAARSLPVEGGARIDQISSGIGSAMAKSKRFAQALANALDQAGREVAGRLRIAGIDPDARKAMIEEMNTKLAQIEQILNSVGHANTT